MLRVHFLNVGHGDCTVISHPSGRLTMIDINNSQSYDAQTYSEVLASEESKLRAAADAHRAQGWGYQSNRLLIPTQPNIYADAANAVARDAAIELADPIDFMKKNYPGKSLFRFVLTHPDLDHMRGLKRLHDEIGFTNFWDTNHTKPTPNFRGDADRTDWQFYQTLRGGAKYYTQGSRNFAYNLGENGLDGGDNIEILSPTPALVRACIDTGKSNDLSLVLRVRHGAWSVLLPGDAEEAAWDEMVRVYGDGLKSDYLKASHHGRDSGFHLNALRRIAPRMAFVSVGKKPDTDASSKYRQQCDRVASTRYHGNMELRFHDDGRREWFVERNAGCR